MLLEAGTGYRLGVETARPERPDCLNPCHVANRGARGEHLAITSGRTTVLEGRHALLVRDQEEVG